MTRVLLAVGGFVLVTLAAIVLYLTFADLGRFRPEVEAAISTAVGRDFRIAGDFKPKVFPRPSFVATEVTLANAEWGAPTPMISIGSASAEIGLWSLLFGPIRIKSLEVHDVAVLLEQDASGARQLGDRARGAVRSAAPDANTEWQGLPLIIELASVGNVTAIWKQPGADDFPATLATLSLRTDESRTIVVEAGGQVREVPFTVNGSIVKVDANRARRRARRIRRRNDHTRGSAREPAAGGLRRVLDGARIGSARRSRSRACRQAPWSWTAACFSAPTASSYATRRRSCREPRPRSRR